MNFKDSKSIYLQIADRICDEILQGTYGADERIPSVRDYAVEVEVNVNTMMRSYDYLQQQNIIYNKRGVGYFVEPKARKLILQIRKASFVKEALPDFLKQIHTLGIPMSDIVQEYERIYSPSSIQND